MKTCGFGNWERSKIDSVRSWGGGERKWEKQQTHWRCHEMLFGEASCFLLRSSCYNLTNFPWISSIFSHGEPLHVNHKQEVLNFQTQQYYCKNVYIYIYLNKYETFSPRTLVIVVSTVAPCYGLKKMHFSSRIRTKNMPWTKIAENKHSHNTGHLLGIFLKHLWDVTTLIPWLIMNDFRFIPAYQVIFLLPWRASCRGGCRCEQIVSL